MMCKTKYRAPALIVLFGASVCAFAAEPPSQDASPAVSGEQLENLNREPSTDTSAAAPSDAPAQAAAPAPPSQPQASAAGGNDRLQLETTIVTGNRELPKVLYIVPWKKAELGELPAQPFNTLLDEVLTPVDRDVFRREVTYFDAVTRNAGANQSTSATPP